MQVKGRAKLLTVTRFTTKQASSAFVKDHIFSELIREISPTYIFFNSSHHKIPVAKDFS